MLFVVLFTHHKVENFFNPKNLLHEESKTSSLFIGKTYEPPYLNLFFYFLKNSNMTALHSVSRIMDDSKSDILAVDRFTRDPMNKIPANFGDFHKTLKFIDQQKKESIDAQQTISSLNKKAVEATEAGLLQDALNLRKKITGLIPVAYATNLAM